MGGERGVFRRKKGHVSRAEMMMIKMVMQRRVDGMICREHVELELYLLEAHHCVETWQVGRKWEVVVSRGRC